MPQTAEEIRVGADGQIYVAPEGTAQPANVDTALNAAFGTALGYASEDGVQFSAGKTTEDIGAWQSLVPLRTLVSSTEVFLRFALRQWRGTNIKLAFGGGTISGAGAYWKYSPPAASALAIYVAVVDWQDGGYKYRCVVPRCQIAETVDVQLTRTAAADLPIALKVLAPTSGDPWYLLSNDATFQS
jgi:hypothetical protein